MLLDILVPLVGALLLVWAIFFQRKHLSAMADTPTSKVRSVAMGFAELKGTAEAAGPLVSPISGTACVYYHYTVESEYIDGKGHRRRSIVRKGTSRGPFYLNDGTGRILVFPEGAQMRVTNRNDSMDGELLVTEYCILPGDPLYVLGTVAGAQDFSAPAMDAGGHYDQELKRLRAALADADANPGQWAGPEALRAAKERFAAEIRALEAKKAETAVEPAEDYGTAPAIGKGAEETEFVIATESEEELSSQMDTESGIALIAGAAILLYGAWTFMKK